MTRKRSFNQARDGSVYLPLRRPAAPVPETAEQLDVNRLRLLAELAARHGGHPTERCGTLFGYFPTTADVEAIDARIALLRAADPADWDARMRMARERAERAGCPPRARARDADGLGVVVGV